MNHEAIKLLVARIVRGQVRAYLQANPHMVSLQHQKPMTDDLTRRISSSVVTEHHIDVIRKALAD